MSGTNGTYLSSSSLETGAEEVKQKVSVKPRPSQSGLTCCISPAYVDLILGGILNDNITTKRDFSGARNLLVGIGALFGGFAAMVIALQWETHTTISIDPPRHTEEPRKLGFTLLEVNEEATSLSSAKSKVYMLDRDTGRVWIRHDYETKWKEDSVEGIPCLAGYAATTTCR